MRHPGNIFGSTLAAAMTWAAMIVPASVAQERLTPPTPLAAPAPPPAGSRVVSLSAAQRAQDLGLPSVAVAMYRQWLDVPGVDRRAVSLALVTALLDAGESAEAERVLATVPEPRDAAWQVRAGLAALHLGKRDAAQAAHDAIRPEELTPADLPWFWFLRGALYDTAPVRDMRRANENYTLAETSATTELARARFQLTAEQLRLRLHGRPSEADIRAARDNYERYQGRTVGYGYAKTHAAMLAEAGQRNEAVAFLQRVLLTVPAQERGERDELRFLLGLIGDRGRNGAGRNALGQLLENGQSAERQRQALQLLSEASREEPARGQFRAELTRLIAARPPHPIAESLLFYRAQLALNEKDFVRAEDDAAALLNQFPRSPLRVHAFGVLTQSAWEQRRYRVAAANARRAREELKGSAAETTATAQPAAPAGTGRLRAELAVLEAEAWFRGGDFRNAADAYEALLRERPPELPPAQLGALMFQRILAEIKSGSGAAAKVLDEIERDPAFDPENRWQAEWSLARSLQLQGEAGAREAYARISALLREPAPSSAGLKPELRARVAWLEARLAFENDEFARTIELVDKLLAASLGIDAGLKAEISSTLVLLKARSELALKRESVALETLKRLRADYPKTDAAISSHLIESEHYASQEKIDEARRALIALTDNRDYRSSEYVPLALFRLALLSERLGREENLHEANRRIEELVTSSAVAGQSDLIFAARLKQGDIFRKLNDFPAAQRAYEDLVNRYAQRPDVVLAQLELAKTHNAQSSSNDAQHLDSAQLIFEQLRDRVNAPPDVRAEAGYNLGLLLQRRGKPGEAAVAWWDIVNEFLGEKARPIEPGATRPYWLSRTLHDLGDLLEKQNRLDEAREAYLLLLRKRLPNSEAIARARLEQLGVRLPPR